jgi:hypothetical protein
MDPFIKWFDQEFERLEADWRNSIQQLDSSMLYSENQQQLSAAAEQIVRSARIVEQVSGGITANLWDDPFEWTLPETLSTKDKLIAYLNEVHDARARAFALFTADADLLKTVMAPRGPTQLMSLLLDAITRARHHEWQAFAEAKTEREFNSSHTADLRS